MQVSSYASGAIRLREIDPAADHHGLNTASSGTIRYRGEVLVGVNPHATIVFQTFALYPWLTVQANVEVALKARGVPEMERRTRAIKLIDTVGLDGFESAYPRELSGGMRQKGGLRSRNGGRAGTSVPRRAILRARCASAEALRGELMELMAKQIHPYAGHFDGDT